MGFPVGDVVEMEGGAVARQVASRKTHHQQPARAGCQAVARIQVSFRDGKWRTSAPDSRQKVGRRMAASCVPPSQPAGACCHLRKADMEPKQICGVIWVCLVSSQPGARGTNSMEQVAYLY